MDYCRIVCSLPSNKAVNQLAVKPPTKYIAHIDMTMMVKSSRSLSSRAAVGFGSCVVVSVHVDVCESDAYTTTQPCMLACR